MSLRVGIANNLPHIRERAEQDLAAIGIKANVGVDGFVEITPLNASSVRDFAAIDSLIAQRSDARRRKDWKESDRIRDELLAMGVVLKDSKNGTTWDIAR